ncbi:MAG: phosphotransferase enzyme family protein [Candidatus Promineifilaceae bacterium]
MEKEIRDRLSEGVVEEARRRYGIAAGEMRPLDAFESFIYEFERDGRSFILRLGHSRRRTPELIHGEVDWINYLAAGGAGVAAAVNSAGGDLVEQIPDGQGGQFLATAFVKAAGGPVGEMGGWSDEVVDAYGRLLGRIHALSKGYTPGSPAWRRPEWDWEWNLNLPPLEPALDDHYQAVLGHLHALPRDSESYGMIHQDAHAGNFFVDEAGRITLFDFDDCVHGHFAYDLAMVLFYAVTNRGDAAEFAPHFWRRFMNGYAAENDLDPVWQREIPYFMTLREIDLYAIIQRDYDSLAGDTWVESFMDGRRERIVAGMPYLEMDF